MDLRDKILTADDLRREPLTLERWCVTVYVRELTGTERAEYETLLIENKDQPMAERIRNMRDSLIALTTVNEAGERVFNSDDIEELGKKNAAELERVYDLSMTINRLDEKDIEADAGNLEPSGSDDSISE